MGAITVFFHRAAIPSVHQWNDALRAEGFDLVIDPFDLLQEDGYRPAMLCGHEVAFDWLFYKSFDLDEEDAPFISPHIGDRDVRTDLDGKEEGEELAGRIAGAVLAKITNGLYWDREQSTIVVLPGNAAVEVAKKALADWKKQNG
jgi:hypothetical protein